MDPLAVVQPLKQIQPSRLSQDWADIEDLDMSLRDLDVKIANLASEAQDLVKGGRHLKHRSWSTPVYPFAS